MNNKYVKTLILVAAFLVLGLVTTASFAYFSATVNGNTNAEATVITTGHMELKLTDGNQVTLNSALPGTSTTKTFKVKNTGTVATTYDVYLSEILNNFVDKNDLVYTVTSESGCQTTTQTVVPSVSSDQSKIVSSCSINANQEHEYILTITFKEDNTNQDDNKGKKFSAKISVNEYKEFSNIATQLIAKKTDGATDLEYDGVATLGQYGTSDNNLRYVGASPSNYVYYNCSTTDPTQMNDSTCEKWRIIGVMNNVEDENQIGESRVKIIRDESIGSYSWDGNPSSTGRGSNQWGESTYSDGTQYEGTKLMQELNTDYLGNITVGTDGKWYRSTKVADMPTNLLNSNAVSMIESVVWHLGSASANGDSLDNDWPVNLDVITAYNRERTETHGKHCTNQYACNDDIVRKSTWTGKVGLFYFSDYGYATSGGTTTSKSDCLGTGLSYWPSTQECRENDWLYVQYHQWTMTPFAYHSGNNYVFRYSSYGYPEYNVSLAEYNVRPVLFLKNNISIDSGEGSSLSPYKLVMN